MKFTLLYKRLQLLKIKREMTECHPQCSWVADNPMKNAVCEPYCRPPVCAWKFNGSEDSTALCGATPPTCSIRCPKDECEDETAPHCETLCQPHATEAVCSPLCEEPRCAWACTKPTDMPIPRFELVCEKPAADIHDLLDQGLYTVRPMAKQPTPNWLVIILAYACGLAVCVLVYYMRNFFLTHPGRSQNTLVAATTKKT